MAVDNSLESLLATLTCSIQSATDALPTDGIVPPKEGISLLDVKNDLLLSYLQNLVFLILLKLRSRTRSRANSKDSTALDPTDEVVQKLIELRIYLEKGVRPLENKLKYNIDKIIRTADDAAHRTVKPKGAAAAHTSRAMTHNITGSDSNISDSDSATNSVQSSEDEDEMAYAPRATAVLHKKTEAAEEKARQVATKHNIYRPPKITPMAMPTTETREARRDRRIAVGQCQHRGAAAGRRFARQPDRGIDKFPHRTPVLRSGIATGPEITGDQRIGRRTAVTSGGDDAVEQLDRCLDPGAGCHPPRVG